MMKINKKKGLALWNSKGFTLLELLVVIAIIGILATIATVLIMNAKEKAREAGIISNLKNMIPLAEIYYLENKSYPFTPSGFVTISCLNIFSNHINNISQKFNGSAFCQSEYNETGWGASARLLSNGNINYSVDTSGVVFWDINSDSYSDKMTWDQANTYCSNLGGKLPTYSQFRSIAITYSDPANNSNKPNFLNRFYWTSSQYLNTTDIAIMSNLNRSSAPRTSQNYTICVKPIN